MIDYDTGVDWGEVVRDYLACSSQAWDMTVLELRKKHVISHEELYTFLRAENVPLRGRGHSVPIGRRFDEAVYLYLRGEMHVVEICRRLKISSATLYRKLKKCSAPLRGGD